MLEKFEIEKEIEYLKLIYSEILKQKVNVENSVKSYKDFLKKQIEYSADAFYNMDEEEISATKTILENQELDVIKQEDLLKRLNLSEKSAYFGRIDFNNVPYYIGVSSLLSENEKLYVSDWRAPISSLFYDFELGQGKYLSPDGEVVGEITKKRQYKVQQNNLIYAFDSSLTISDEILREALSAGTSEKMKNIVSTIQNEQNRIIRASESRNLLIQGEAGSGKTSIALHRAAYLMYRQAGRLTANDIMIISPNKLFSEYISNILPELGERNIIETTFNNLATSELPKIKIYNRDESIDRALRDSNFAKEVKLKNSFDFFEKLKIFLKNFSFSNFEPKDIILGEKVVKKEVINDLFNNKYAEQNPAVKLGWIADYVVDEFKLPRELHKRVLGVVYNMFSNNSMMEVYSEFLKSQGISFETKKGLFFEDVPAVLYVKDYIFGLQNKQSVKYLLIDEMQDYNTIYYYIFNKLFSCPKLVLGDINQDIFSNYSNKDLEKLCNLIGDCDLVKLTKSYRSTYEISKFCQNIKNLNYNVVDRHGLGVKILKTLNLEDEISKIVEVFEKNKNKRVSLICKNQDEAKYYYELLKEKIENISFIESDLNISGDKIILSSANSKGIEFDVVIIPNVSKLNYSGDLGKNVLYVSATRALHELYITSVSEMPDFI